MSGRQRARAYVPALATAAVGLVLLVLDQRPRAVVLLMLAALAAGLIAAGVDLATPMSRLIGLIVRWINNLLSWAVGVAVFLPAWVWTRARRRDPLRNGTGRGWVAVDAADASTQARRSAPVRSIVGLVVLLLSADVALGVAWNRMTGSGPTAPPGAIRVEPPAFDDTAVDTATDGPRDARADLPAMSGSLWAEDYFRELNSVGLTYWPFTLYRPRDFSGEHVNIRDWERRGHRPERTDGAPVLALFGGSAAFGEGQRDVGTIASQVSMLAEEAGLPMVVRNFGQRGWVLWQEMTLYEQLLADGERFDFAVFYDGANDTTVQNEPVNGVPTHYDVEEYALRLAQPVGPGAEDAAERGLAGQVVAWWQARSAAYRTVSATGLVPRPRVGGRNDEWQERPGWDERGVAVYLRARGLVEHLSTDHGVEAGYFWQPQRFQDERYRNAARAASPMTVDLSGVLDGRDGVYLDSVHTNEAGARLVAEAMWSELEPSVRQWYDLE